MRAREDEKPYSTQGSQRNNANNNNQRNEHHGHQQNSGTPRETQAGQHHHGNRRGNDKYIEGCLIWTPYGFKYFFQLTKVQSTYRLI